MSRLGLVTSILLLSAITTAQAGEYYVKHKGDKREGAPTETEALVYVFRPATVGGAIKTWAFADDQLLGVSKSHGYYYELVPPGKHVIWAKAENTSGLDVELQAGQTYYFKAAIKMGFGKARVKLIQIDEAEAQKYLKKCSYTEPTDEGRLRAAEIAANRLDRAAANAAEKSDKAGK